MDHVHATIGNRAVGRLVQSRRRHCQPPSPANGADGADQQLFPILDRSSNQKIMVDAVRYEEERVHPVQR